MKLSAGKAAVLRKYGLTSADLLSQGMEAEVYACDPGTLLKLYRGAGCLADLSMLRDFYARLERGGLSYALPTIQQVSVEGEFCVSIEPRMPGVPLSNLLPGLEQAQMDAAMHTYLSALMELSLLPLPEFERYLLFDPHRLSGCAEGDYHHFLARWLAHKLAQVAPHLGRDVSDFERKVQQMTTILTQPYTGSLRLVHGDFFPGNLLVDAGRRVTALLDFGFMTHYGDPLFDVATGWVFFDMYDELRANLRERLLAIILERLGAQVFGKLARYVLLYSLLSANAYSDCTDGHYHWCVENLNRRAYWDAAE